MAAPRAAYRRSQRPTATAAVVYERLAGVPDGRSVKDLLQEVDIPEPDLRETLRKLDAAGLAQRIKGTWRAVELEDGPARAARASPDQARAGARARSCARPRAPGARPARLPAMADEPRRRPQRAHPHALHAVEEHLAHGLLAEAVVVEPVVDPVGERRAALVALLVLDVARARRSRAARPAAVTRFISATESQKRLSCSSVEQQTTRSNESFLNTLMSFALPLTAVISRVAGELDEVEAVALGARQLREAQERVLAHQPADLERALGPDPAAADDVPEPLLDPRAHAGG